MKKIVSLALAAVMCIGMGTTAMAADINVTVDGKAVQWTDAKPFIKDGRTLVPLRPIANALGLTVAWNAEAQQAGFGDGETTVVFQLNSKAYGVFVGDDFTEVKMDTAAISEGGRTYAPAKYLAQAFGYNVGWDQATQTVKITSGNAPAPAPEKGSINDLPITVVDDVAGSRWNFCGAIVDGKELTDAEFQRDLNAYGGTMEVYFVTNELVELNQGHVQFMYGACEDRGEGYMITFDNGLKYGCVFTEDDGELFMIWMTDATGENAVYFHSQCGDQHKIEHNLFYVGLGVLFVLII